MNLLNTLAFTHARSEKFISATKAGPGRMPKSRRNHRRAGTTIIKRFIRDAKGENWSYRIDWARRTGLPGDRV